MLLATFGSRRPTRDVDFLALHLVHDIATVRFLVIEVAGMALGDGLVFNTHGARAETIRDEDKCSGVRVRMTATLTRALVTFHVDAPPIACTKSLTRNKCPCQSRIGVSWATGIQLDPRDA